MRWIRLENYIIFPTKSTIKRMSEFPAGVMRYLSLTRRLNRSGRKNGRLEPNTMRQAIKLAQNGLQCPDVSP